MRRPSFPEGPAVVVPREYRDYRGRSIPVIRWRTALGVALLPEGADDIKEGGAAADELSVSAVDMTGSLGETGGRAERLRTGPVASACGSESGRAGGPAAGLRHPGIGR